MKLLWLGESLLRLGGVGLVASLTTAVARVANAEPEAEQEEVDDEYAKLKDYGRLDPVDCVEKTSVRWNRWRDELSGDYTHHVLVVSDAHEKGKQISSKGKQQADELALTLKHLLKILHGYQVRIYESQSLCSKDTCRYVMERMHLGKKVRLLEDEKNPGPSGPARRHAKPFAYSESKLERLPGFDTKLADVGFDRVFRRKVSRNSLTVVFAKADMSHYLACKALQLPLDCSLRFEHRPCSITWLAIKPDGEVKCIMLNDSGFLPSNAV